MARKLPLLDAGWLAMETRETPMHVAGLQLYAVPAGAPEDYLEQVYDWMMAAPRPGPPFNLKIRAKLPGALDAAWVEDDAFDLDYHVRRAALPRPGRIRELLALVSRLHAQRLDRDRPLWECYVIEGVEGGRFAVYTKMHHSQVDGIAGMRLTASRLGRSPAEKLPPFWSEEWQRRAPPRSRAEPRPSRSLAAVLKDVRGGAGQLGAMLRLPKEGHAKSIYRAPKTLFNVPVTGARRFAAQSWSLARIKAAGKARGATVNDVFLAMCAGGLREYLVSQRALPDQPLVAQVPVALRSADEADEGGNAITAVQVSLATHIADPLARLAAIQESMNATKTRFGAMQKAEIDVFTMLTNLPLSIGQITGLAGRVKPLFNLVISNVPGPREALYFNGAELLANYPVSLIWHGYAVNITVLSYRDNLDIGIIACRDTVPRVQRMLDHLEAALAELE